MTTRPTDEEIRARFAQLLAQRTNTSSTCHIDPMRLKELRDMWLAERQAARDGVTGEIVESIVELACRFKNDEIESVDDLYPLVRAALQSVMPIATNSSEISSKLVDDIVMPVSVPDGWQLVPVRPDMKMSHAAHAAWKRVLAMGAIRPNDTTMPFVMWDAMLAAAPSHNGKKEG